MKKIIVRCLLLILLFLVLSLIMPFSFSAKPRKKNLIYDNVMAEALEGKNPKVTDIAMLGAHDAFSHNMKLFSKICEHEEGIMASAIAKYIANGLAVRMSRAQNASAKEMLYAGVRYFDVRISHSYGEYYTKHIYLSDTLASYVVEVIDFLESHQGEFIIFDIQHFSRGDDISYSDLNEYLGSIKNDNGKSLYDFVYYNGKYNTISDLTYNDVTMNGTASGVIILAKTPNYESIIYRDLEDSKKDDTGYNTIRSLWHNTNSTKEMLDGIEEEYQYLLNNPELVEGKLVVNQAQKTALQTNTSIIKSLFSWSLLDMASSFNSKLIKQENFSKWLEVMPIFMVDNVTSMKGSFNKLANEKIIEFNKNL